MLFIIQSSVVLPNNKVCEFESSSLTGINNGFGNWKRNIEYYISVQQLYALIQKKASLFMVDLRVGRNYDLYHINGSYNFPRETLLTRPQLKNKHIVLINDGIDYKRSEELLLKLKKIGFKEVIILDGGVPYWLTKMEKGNEILFNNNVSFDGLFNEDLTDWTIFNLTEDVFDLSQHTNNVSIKKANKDANPAKLKQLIGNSTSLVGNVLLIANDNFIDLYKNWQSKLDANIFVMSGSDFKSGLNKKDLNKRINRYKKRTDGASFACE
ncbi:hypothetical protein GCM10011365_20550 [Marinicella pacifica]|uniref:Rhodanese domain-containing protein n=1 Tax=Marinicella pacifica TaxID=1171543 RepID=A0A917CWM0_9GAMM|nr:hypothetical protein GCM10011365_20550 [Marinicella pacifica]